MGQLWWPGTHEQVRETVSEREYEIPLYRKMGTTILHPFTDSHVSYLEQVENASK